MHAWYIIAKYPEQDYEGIPQDAESHRVTYVIVQGPNGEQRRVPKTQTQPSGYGATAPLAPPVHQSQNGTWNDGAGSSGGNAGPSTGPSNQAAVPPSYAEAVKGDHKVQTRD